MSVREFHTVAVSGYFDPLHRGHVDYLRNARALGDRLVVILNNDDQRAAPPRTPLEDRRVILESMRCVDEVIISVDRDATVCKTLERLRPKTFGQRT